MSYALYKNINLYEYLEDTTSEDVFEYSNELTQKKDDLQKEKEELLKKKGELLALQNETIIDAKEYEDIIRELEAEYKKAKKAYNNQIADRDKRRALANGTYTAEEKKEILNTILHKHGFNTEDVKDILLYDLAGFYEKLKALENTDNFISQSDWFSRLTWYFDRKVSEIHIWEAERYAERYLGFLNHLLSQINSYQDSYQDIFDLGYKIVNGIPYPDIIWQHPKTGRTYKRSPTNGEIYYYIKLLDPDGANKHVPIKIPSFSEIEAEEVLNRKTFYWLNKNTAQKDLFSIENVFSNRANELVLKIRLNGEEQFLYLEVFLSLHEKHMIFGGDSDTEEYLSAQNKHSKLLLNLLSEIKKSSSEIFNDIEENKNKLIENANLLNDILREWLKEISPFTKQEDAWQDYDLSAAKKIYKRWDAIKGLHYPENRNNIINTAAKTLIKKKLHEINSQIKEIDAQLKVIRQEFKVGNGVALVNFLEKTLTSTYHNIPISERAIFWGWLCKHIRELSITLYKGGKSEADFNAVFKDITNYKTKGSRSSDWDARSGYIKVDSAANIPASVQRVFDAMTAYKFILSKNNVEKQTGKFVGNKLESVELVYYILRHYSDYGFKLGPCIIDSEEAYELQQHEFPDNEKEFDQGWNS